jgi:hypothetical protein
VGTSTPPRERSPPGQNSPTAAYYSQHQFADATIFLTDIPEFAIKRAMVAIFAMSRPIVLTACMPGSPDPWSPHRRPLHATYVEVEEPSTASEADVVSSAFAVAEVERSTCEGMLKDCVTVAAVGLLRLKGLL